MKLENFAKELIQQNLISQTEITIKNSNQLIITNWNWNYSESLNVQELCVSHVLENENHMIFIFCSHPITYTLGRGLQKLKNSETILVDFQESHKIGIEENLISIKRGGGLTFHHPGQFVFYPILKTTKWNFKVHDFMLEILNITKVSLEFSVDKNNLKINKELLGLWFQEDNYQVKLASIGLAVNRFVTYHGLALNFFSNDQIKNEIKNLYPCGLPGVLYSSIEDLREIKKIKTTTQEFNQFVSIFQIEFYSMIDKQISSLPIKEVISEIDLLEITPEIITNTELSLS